MADDSIALCIPAYNAAAHLPRLFESVRRQTVPFDEIWVYDDASADATGTIARAFGARVVRGNVNRGCSEGKNTLLAQAQAGWIHFHDSDDVLLPEFAARAKARIAGGNFDALLFDYEQRDEASGERMSRSDFSHSALLDDPVAYMLANTVNNCGIYETGILRRVGGFDADPAVRHNEDRAFHLRLAEAGARFAVEPYVGCRFYFRKHSMSAANKVQCILANQEITRRYAVRHPGRHLREIGDASWLNAGALASFLQWDEADRCVQLATQSSGRVPRNGGALFSAMCAIAPRFAIVLRERLIRLFKPHLRADYPH